LHPRLSNPYQYSKIHQENRHPQSARLGGNHLCLESSWRDLRASMPG
jgi:hypothetical protein